MYKKQYLACFATTIELRMFPLVIIGMKISNKVFRFPFTFACTTHHPRGWFGVARQWWGSQCPNKIICSTYPFQPPQIMGVAVSENWIFWIYYIVCNSLIMKEMLKNYIKEQVLYTHTQGWYTAR